MRKNHSKRQAHASLDTFDRQYVELPSNMDVARVIVMPMKTIFINIAASPETNVDWLFYDIDDAQDFFERAGDLLP